MSGDQVLFRSEAREGRPEVLLVREPDGHIAMTIDGFWQFSSREEFIFHEVLADAAMVMAPDPGRVLILGGGDALALRNVLRYPELRHVTLVEIDAEVLEMVRTVPALAELSEHALNDPRVEVVVADANTWIDEPREPYDVVICDFPAPSRDELTPLFSTAFYERLSRSTHERSIVSIQVSQDLPDFWATLTQVEEVFPHTMPLLAELLATEADDEAWADFILASPAPISGHRDPANNARFLAEVPVSDLHIRNRDGDHFVTKRYGNEPRF